MKLLTTRKAADYLGVSTSFLERDRCDGPTIPVVYVGERTPRYRVEDLDRYLDSRLRVQPSDADDEVPWDEDFDDDVEAEEGVDDEY